MNPLLRWAGSKRQLIPKLFEYWQPKHARYLEPFAGSACLFFAIAPVEAVLGDLNKYLINTYRMVKRSPYHVIEALHRLPKNKKAYYQLRSKPFWTLAEAEQAAAFIYLNKFCFNGLFRTNSKGLFNVPYGNTRGNSTINIDQILLASRLLQNTHLYSGDFEGIVRMARPGDFVYFDPPYWTDQKRSFVQYQSNPFGVSDLKRLENVLDSLNRSGIDFLVSYADCPEGRKALGRWKIDLVSTRRNIAGFAEHRNRADELLATNITLEDKG
jgi:DNA adenine methylase